MSGLDSCAKAGLEIARRTATSSIRMVSSGSVTRANSYGAFRAAQSQEMGILAAKVDAVRRPPHVRDGVISGSRGLAAGCLLDPRPTLRPTLRRFQAATDRT